MKRFSDFAQEPTAMTGEKVKMDDLLGKEIEVTGYKIGDSKQKAGTKLLTLQFKLDDEERILFTGSNVLLEQVEKVGHEGAQEYVKEFDMLDRAESYMSLVYTELAALKTEEAQRKIDELESELEALKNKLEVFINGQKK